MKAFGHRASLALLGTPRIGRDTARAVVSLDWARRRDGLFEATADVVRVGRNVVDQIVILEDWRGRARYYVVCLN